MRSRTGLILMVLGLLFLTAAGGLWIENRQEDRRAGAESSRLLTTMETITAAPPGTEPTLPEEAPDDLGLLGRLTIPVLELELPVQSEWDDSRLRISPCRYSGTVRGEDLVLLAHNYRTHFGPIRRLRPGDLVVFEDLEGGKFDYLVSATDVVPPEALESVTAGRHDLTLITCTYGGQTRLVVYCDGKEP